MSLKAASVQGDAMIGHAELPTLHARMNFSQLITRAYSSVADPSRNVRPLEAHEVTIRDARGINQALSLDEEGFKLFRHESSVSHLRDAATLQAQYHTEVGALIRQITGADFVLPYRAYCQVRLSQRARDENGDETTRPAGFVHSDVTDKTFRDWAQWVQEAEHRFVPRWRRCVFYNTWRAVSPPPQDFPLALTDGRSVKPGHYVVMDNDVGLDTSDRSVETRLGLFDPENRWYYFSDMTEDELLVFKGYDSAFKDLNTVMHSSFDNTQQAPQAVPRESIEARFFAYWV